MTNPSETTRQKPLGIKACGSIPHLPDSRLGPGDHMCHRGQARIATHQTRDWKDRVIVTEKLDGSCVAITNINGELVALNRAGYRADESPWEQHRMFAQWVADNHARFQYIKDPFWNGGRIIGEWLAQAHGTRYALAHEPFVMFAAMNRHSHIGDWDRVVEIANHVALPTPHVLSDGPACPIDTALERLGTHGHHGARDAAEGCVWRIER